MIFVAGLPRSGSTLLQNILGQNPNFFVTETSGLLPTLVNIRNNWEIPLHQTISTEESRARLKRTLKGILENYHGTNKIIFDKNRAWPNHIEMLEWVLDEKVKIILTVRDTREILASFEKLWRKNKAFRKIPQEDLDFNTIEGRSKTWLKNNQPLGFALNTIKDAQLRGFSNRMFTVKYDDLVTYPQATILSIYVWLGFPFFNHDFNDIKQITQENDEVHQLTGLHDIESVVEKPTETWDQILGKAGREWM